MNATNIEEVAVRMVGLGLDRLGYRYLSVDDCWAVARNKTTGVIVEDPKSFPDGMKAVADCERACSDRGFGFGTAC